MKRLAKLGMIGRDELIEDLLRGEQANGGL